MFSPSPIQLMIVLIIALLLFGNRLPQVMRSLGKGVTEFKKGVNGVESEISDAIHAAPETSNSDKKE